MSATSTVGVRELRQNLSVYLMRVKAGESLMVTEHGRPVAELRSLAPAGDPVGRLVADGRVRPPASPDAQRPRPLSLRLARSASAALDELRGDSI